MLRHDEPSHQLRRPEFDRRTNEGLENESIYAFIVEVEQAANCLMPRELPVIALCDAGSRTNWVSSKFVEDLERSFSTNLKPSNRSGRRKGSDALRINIRWTCGKLGQYSAEGTFLIEPKAHFKILFGCGLEFKPLPTEHIGHFRSRYTGRKGNKVQKDASLSEQIADSLRQGIEDGTLLRLKRMPQLPEKRLSSVSFADLEAELEYIYAIDSLTEGALSSDFIEDDNSSCIISSVGDLLSSIEISSIRDSETDVDEHAYAESANTSVSDDPYRGNSLTERLRVERGLHPPYSLEGWFGQEVCEEPQPFLSRMIQPKRTPFYFSRCSKLNLKQQQALTEAKAAAQKTTRDYWQWDEVVKNYKHYDEGSSEPVWYNPP